MRPAALSFPAATAAQAMSSQAAVHQTEPFLAFRLRLAAVA